MVEMNHNAMVALVTLKNAGFESYFAGGCVRDSLLNLPVHDWDLATSATPDQVAELFSTSKLVGKNFGVSVVNVNGEQFEVATFREDGAYSDNRRPDSVKFTTDPREDVKRRDFTVNALLMDESGKVFDFVNGLADLENKVLRTVGNPSDRFQEDALRLLRAVRFAARLEFMLDPLTVSAMTLRSKDVTTLPADRVAGELAKMLTGGNVQVAFQTMDTTGLLVHFMPELCNMHGVTQNSMWHPEGDVWQHTMKMLSMLESGCSLTLALATLLHDVGKPVTAKTNEKTGHNQFHGHEHVGARMAERLLRDFRFSNEVVGTVSSLVENHMRFFNTEKMSLSKMKRFVRMENFSELLELNRVDSLGSNGDLTANNFCRGFRDNMKDELHPVRLLTGNDLLAMGFKAGPVFKTLLEAVETAQLEGVVTTREEAVALVTASSGKV